MIKNLFVSLYKYRLCEEDFFTAAFGYVLNLDNQKIARAILKKLGIILDDSTEISIRVQPSLSGIQKRPDMEIKSKNFIVLLENKIGSGPSGSDNEDGDYSEQSKYYKDFLNGPECRQFACRKLIKIVRDYQKPGEEDIGVYWSDVYKWIKEVKTAYPADSLSTSYVEEFFQLMEVLHMNPVQFQKHDIQLVKRYRDMEAQIRRILDEAEAGICKNSNFTVIKFNSSGVEDSFWYYYQSRSLRTSAAKFALFLFLGGPEGEGPLLPEIFFWSEGTKPQVLEKLRSECSYKNYESDTSWKGVYKDLVLSEGFLELSPEKQKAQILQVFSEEIARLGNDLF
jgi:hypothetical protein